MNRFLHATLAFLILAMSAFPSSAADSPFSLSAERDGLGFLEIKWAIEPGHYLYRDKIAIEHDGIPVAAETPQGVTLEDINFGTVEVYRNNMSALLADPGSGMLSVAFQGCKDNSICFPPEKAYIDSANLKLSFVNSPSEASGSIPEFAIAESRTDIFSALADQGGSILVVAGFFGFGLLLSLTPCVLPMYPILAAFLRSQGDRLDTGTGLKLSATYVTSMASAFAMAGAAAGLSGNALGSALQSPAAIIGMTAVFILLALSSFGAFDLRLPAAVSNWAVRNSRKGGHTPVASAAFFGLGSAFIIGPCVTAPLAAGLLYIAKTGDVMLGASALFALGLGKGTPLVIAGTFGSAALPKSGPWTITVNRAFGFAFLAAAVWVAGTLMPWGKGAWLASLVVTAGAIHTLYSLRPKFHLLIAATLAAAWLSLAPHGAWLTSKGQSLDFEVVTTADGLARQLDVAVKKGIPTAAYFSADWCVTCKALEATVFTDGRASSSLSQLHLVKVDLSDFGVDQKRLLEATEVIGPPTMIFFDAHGREVPGTRLIGDLRPSDIASSATAAR